MTNNKTAYLPIGSVVTLGDSKKSLMIIGRKQMQSKSQTIWDYVACLHPEGILGDDYNLFFQQSEIGAILHKGYEGEDEKKILKLLNETQSNSKNNKQINGVNKHAKK
ncbi:MAG: DUF4176 domain-containing protein [Bacillota bacterium]